ncbi:hypothetical protein [Jannaschia rubra]|uniref:hypothetical protein n=1 Tax=Jannaschia rubra TaxID=282197 RepID=UPI001160B34F|nr:hypothetical protein [Jannaschia rubra]
MDSKKGSGETAKQLIRLGARDDEALELVLFLHPGAKTTPTTIRHYRSEMRADFEDVKIDGEAPGLDRARLRALVLGWGEVPSTPGSKPTQSYREITRDKILLWWTNRQVLDAVLAAWPDCGYTTNNVSDLRSRLRAKDELVPDDDAARRWQEGRPWAIDPKPPAGLKPPAKSV